jgi:hypothetical protein
MQKYGHVGVLCYSNHLYPLRATFGCIKMHPALLSLLTANLQKQFNRESSSSRSGDPAVNKLQSKTGSPLREDNDSHISKPLTKSTTDRPLN